MRVGETAVDSEGNHRMGFVNWLLMLESMLRFFCVGRAEITRCHETCRWWGNN